MKFQILALAAALAFGGAAFAADTSVAPVSPDSTHVVKVKPHATRHATRHAARHHRKVVRHVAVKHQKAAHLARHHAMHEQSASVRTDVNGGSRDARMDEALQKFRSSHS